MIARLGTLYRSLSGWQGRAQDGQSIPSCTVFSAHSRPPGCQPRMPPVPCLRRSPRQIAWNGAGRQPGIHPDLRGRVLTCTCEPARLAVRNAGGQRTFGQFQAATAVRALFRNKCKRVRLRQAAAQDAALLRQHGAVAACSAAAIIARGAQSWTRRTIISSS